MSDARLRELERQWKETADPEAGATYLRARVRNGTLTSEALELAAYLGDRAACAALERPVNDPPPAPAPTPASVVSDGGVTVPDAPPAQDPRDVWLGEWIKGLNRWGKEPSIRAALAAARRDPELTPAVERVKAWLATAERPIWGHDDTTLDRVVGARGTLTASLRAAVLADRAAKHASVVALRDEIRLELVTWLYGSAPPIEIDDWAEAQLVAMHLQREREELEERALTARVTAGSLTPKQLELLAYLGHAPARRALKLAPGAHYHQLDSWLNGIGRYGVEALARAATALRALPWHHERPIRWREGSRSWARSLIKQLDLATALPLPVRDHVRDALVPWILGTAGEAGDADLR